MNYVDYLKTPDTAIPGTDYGYEQAEYRIALETRTFDDEVVAVTGKIYKGEELVGEETFSMCEFKIEPHHIKNVQRELMPLLGRMV